MPKCEVEYYESSRGRRPVEDYLNALNSTERLFVNNKIDKLEEQGRGILAWGHDHADYLRDDIYELKADYRRKRHRVFFFFHGNRAILTNATVKKHGAVADSYIEKAIECRSEYFRSH